MSVFALAGRKAAPSRFASLYGVLDLASADGHSISSGIEKAVKLALLKRAQGHRVFFIGNGGSAGIASHMAADWFKAGRFKAACFNDPAMLTCLGNDLGYEHVFDEPIYGHGRQGDLLVAISSSGRSLNILNAVAAAKKADMTAMTLSGFRADNPLRQTGQINFYVPSDKYGLVEVAHHAILHAILDEITSADGK